MTGDRAEPDKPAAGKTPMLGDAPGSGLPALWGDDRAT